LKAKEQVLNITDPFEAFLYVKKLGKRVPELEAIIAKDARCSVLYAVKVLNNERFELGEDVIKTDPKSACRYAIEVLKGRWTEADEILKNGLTKSESLILNTQYYAAYTQYALIPDKLRFSSDQIFKILTDKQTLCIDKQLYDDLVKAIFPTSSLMVSKWMRFGDRARLMIEQGRFE